MRTPGSRRACRCTRYADIAYQNKAVIYDLLFKAAADTMLTIAADPKHLGAKIGITAVLHTWGSAMTHHPHLHMIVPGGGLSLDGKKWLACRPGFFLPVRVLSRLFRRLFLKVLADAHAAGRLAFFGDHAALANAAAFAASLTPLRKAEWVVYAKKPFGGPRAVLAYLARYTHRVAIANSRLISADETGVTFMEGLSDRRARPVQDHDVADARVHPTLPDPCSAQRPASHPSLRPVRQRQTPRRQYRSCSPIARRATQRSAAEYRSRCRIRSASRSANAVPTLRWPLNHHRDLRARLSAQARSRNNQDRYLMTPSPLPHDWLNHQPPSQALERQRPPARQTGNLVRPHTANVAAQRTGSPPIAVLTRRTIAATTSIQTH